MKVSVRQAGWWRHAVLLLLACSLVVAACGGGSSTASPESLDYAFPTVVYRTDGAIDPNLPSIAGGTPDTWTVDPALPTGLILDPASGVISGTPTTPATAVAHTVTAANDAGSVNTVVNIEVIWARHKSLTVHAPLTDDDLRHFLTKTHWGIFEERYDHLVQVGLPTFMNEMLVFPQVGSTQWEQDAAAFLEHDDDPAGEEGKWPNWVEVARWHIYLLGRNPNPFQEVLAFFWHEHFATSSVVLSGGRMYYMQKQIDMFREKGNGSLRTLILDVCRDWAMLWWLDGRRSTVNAPNENFAREYLELFTLGVDAGYDQATILEAARAFTGYEDLELNATTGLRYMDFVPARHDPNDKTLFGQLIPGQNETDDFEAVVNITIDQRNVAEWISRSLLKYFCYENPPQELIDQLAQVMRDNDYELAPVIATMLQSEAFFSDLAKAGSVKSPVEFTMGFMGATGLELLDGATLDLNAPSLVWVFDDLAQIPTRPPSVNGWPEGRQWLSAQGMVHRANIIRDCIVDRADQAAAGVDVSTLLPAGTPTSAQVVDALALRLHVTLSTEDHASSVTYLDTQRQGDGTVVASPFDPANPTHVDERVRGLLYILAQHPSYMAR